MAVTILDAVSTNTAGYHATISPSAGSNRIVYVVIFNRNVTDNTCVRPTSVTLGGQSMTRIGSQTVPATRDVCSTVYFLNESGITAMSGTTLTVTGGSTTAQISMWWSVQDAYQGAHTLDEAIGSASTSSLSFARPANGYTFHVTAISVDNSHSSSDNPPLTTAQGADGFLRAQAGYEASTSETVSATWSNAFSREFEHVVWNIEAERGDVYVNDAATLDGGEVLQTYPGTANWSDTQIDMQNVIDVGALTGQLYLIVETATGAVASRAITVGGGITDVNFSGHRGIMRGAMRGVG